MYKKTIKIVLLLAAGLAVVVGWGDDPPPAAPPAGPAVSLAKLLAEADVEAGRRAARKCVSCHGFSVSGANRVGPNLYGIVGAAKGGKSGFVYSDAMGRAGGTWTHEDLDAFLENPAAVVPGTRMTFPGLPDRRERAAIIAFLRSVTDNPPPLPVDSHPLGHEE
ncbi:MAG: cytochrome c family protein [Alphaproteobacteria bacterium]|nr:cytochrome c family protein [Alphaproteobacteria bacterium]